MGSQKIKTLLERYWSAESSREEEQLLKRELSASTDETAGKYGILFDYIGRVAKDTPVEPFDLGFLSAVEESEEEKRLRRKNTRRQWSIGIAASIVLVVSSVAYQWPRTETLTARQQEFDRAYSETLAALEKVATTLQTGNASILEISAFDKTKKQIIDVQH